MRGWMGLGICWIAGISFVSISTLSGAQNAAGVPRVDFQREIQPLLIKHCGSCHGDSKQEGGLRLDTSSGIRKGGASGESLLSGEPESNELYRRVTSKEENFRMPKDAPPLAPAELELITNWIRQGSSLPQEMPRVSVIHRSEMKSSWDSVAAVWGWLLRKPYRLQFGLTISGLLILGLLGILIRRKQQRGAQLPRLERWLTGLTVERALLALCATGLTAAVIRSLDVESEWAKQVSELESKVFQQREGGSSGGGGTVAPVPGLPLQYQPFRLRHPNALARTYYRGNCERDEKLFNGGNYLTAKLRLSLLSADGKELSYGDELPQEGVVIHFAIERGPGTAEEFYKGQKMSNIFLGGDEPGTENRKYVHLQPTKPDWIWEADFPIATAGDSNRKLSGTVSVYRGTSLDANPTDAIRHYTLNYDLRIEEGKIAAESDVWCGCTFAVGKIQPPPPQGMMPYQEWFDWRPIPEIQGENTKDPKLLGLPVNPPPPAGPGKEPETNENP